MSSVVVVSGPTRDPEDVARTLLVRGQRRTPDVAQQRLPKVATRSS